MNAISNALVDLRFKIPPEILNIGFRENAVMINQVIGLDERILNSVIRTRVLKDCNLVLVNATWYMPMMKKNPEQEHFDCRITSDTVFFDHDEICDKTNPLPHTLPPL